MLELHDKCVCVMKSNITLLHFIYMYTFLTGKHTAYNISLLMLKVIIFTRSVFKTYDWKNMDIQVIGTYKFYTVYNKSHKYLLLLQIISHNKSWPT